MDPGQRWALRYMLPGLAAVGGSAKPFRRAVVGGGDDLRPDEFCADRCTVFGHHPIPVVAPVGRAQHAPVTAADQYAIRRSKAPDPAFGKDLFPGFPAVSGLEDAALAADENAAVRGFQKRVYVPVF